MKWYYFLILFLLLSGVVFIKCTFFASKIIYVFDQTNKFEFLTTDPDSASNKSIDFSTMEINTFKNEPIYFYFIFSETTPKVEKLKSIQLHLFGKNARGEFQEYKADCELKVEYYDGQNIISKEFNNNKKDLRTLVDWNAVNYKYEFLNKTYIKEKNSISYYHSSHFYPKEYPDTLKLIVELTWENGHRKQELFLHKEKYEGPKLNPKF